jgi:hypothetical protein
LRVSAVIKLSFFSKEAWRSSAILAVETAASHFRGNHLAAVGRLVKAPAFLAMQRSHGIGTQQLQAVVMQIEGTSLEARLPSIFKRPEEQARDCRFRCAVIGTWTDDNSARPILW